MAESVYTHNLGVKRWDLRRLNFHHPPLKSQGVVMVIHNGFKSEPCKTIHYTYNETLEWLRCCEGLEWIHNYSIMVWNVGAMYQTCHRLRLKSRGVVMVIHNELKSQPCKTIHYTYNEMLEGLRCCKIYESVQTYWNLVSKVENR